MADIVDLDSYRQEYARLTMVELKADPTNANRTYLRIIGDSYDDVQSEIDARTAEVESFGNGYAHFFGPCRVEQGYSAIGEVVTLP